ncbi:OmpA family protein [Rapidithrix thailandica]|uniref:OmpA family protein n=1 Tax=Rapidithrix thailandica TaxID=413964 RepID=A0AAW9SA79_9BACT
MSARKILSALTICLSINLLYAQSPSHHLKEGLKLLKKENYREALPYFKNVLNEQPEHAEALYYAGVCEVSYFSIEQGLRYLEKVYELKPKINPKLDYWLGQAYHYQAEFEKAEKHYTRYLSTLKKKDPSKEFLASLIDNLAHGRTLQNVIADYHVHKMSEGINTEFTEHSPILSDNGNSLLFTSRFQGSEESTGANGNYFENIYQVSLQDGKEVVSKASSLGKLGKKSNLASIQLFDQDRKLLIYTDENGGDLQVMDKTDSGWGKPYSISPHINSKGFEAHGYITPDGNTIYFVSNNGTENDDLDIFKADKNEDGTFGKPVNLGLPINTPKDENAPYLSPDGKFMYFSSIGHSSLGGYDVFRSEFDPQTNSWSEPVNLGAPINTAKDDIYFVLSAKGNFGFISSNRSEGKGGMDIYRLFFKQNVQLNGQVLAQQDNTKVQVPEVDVTFENTVNAKKYKTTTDPKGAYSISVPSGNNYQVSLSRGGEPLHVGGEKKVVDVAAVEVTGQQVKQDFFVSPSAVTPLLAKETSTATEEEESTNVIAQNVVLYGAVNSDEETPFEEATISVRELETGRIIANTTIEGNEEYKLEAPIQDGKKYTIDVTANNFKYNDIIDFENNAQKNTENSSQYQVNIRLKEVSEGREFVLKNIYYSVNSFQVTEQSLPTLQKLLKVLQDNPELEIEIRGHTDSTGPSQVNNWLSQARAENVKEYLVKQGVATSRLHAKGYGSKMPLASNDDEKDGRELNRRTEIKILRTAHTRS